MTGPALAVFEDGPDDGQRPTLAFSGCWPAAHEWVIPDPRNWRPDPTIHFTYHHIGGGHYRLTREGSRPGSDGPEWYRAVITPRDVWEQAGWDAADVDHRHCALVIRDLFGSAQRPTVEHLAWFRRGFGLRRAGEQRPPDERWRYMTEPSPPGPVIVFGEPWDAPEVYGATVLPQSETPTYAACLRCQTQIAQGDQGFLQVVLGPVDPVYLVGVMGNGYVLVAVHRQCATTAVEAVGDDSGMGERLAALCTIEAAGVPLDDRDSDLIAVGGIFYALQAAGLDPVLVEDGDLAPNAMIVTVTLDSMTSRRLVTVTRDPGSEVPA